MNPAISYNTRNILPNVQQRTPNPYLPLQKSYASGCSILSSSPVMIFCLQIGLALAQTAAHGVVTQNALIPLAQVPLLGDIPPNFNHNL